MKNLVEKLEDWLDFKNLDVIDSFLMSFSIDKNEAELIFSDMLRFLWLASTYEGDEAGSLLNEIDQPILIIDEMWHTFVLFTKEYREFCMSYMGIFYDHCPITTSAIKSHNDALVGDDAKQEFVDNKRARYTMIYNILGEETFKRWFMIYPEVYSKENIIKLRIR